MKRVLVLVLALGMVLAFTACGEDKSVADGQTTTTTTEQNAGGLTGDGENDIVMGDNTTTTTTQKPSSSDTTGGTVTGTVTSTAAAPQTISPKKNIKMDLEYVAAVYTVDGSMVSAPGLMIQDGGADGLICVCLDAMFESDLSQFEEGVPERQPLEYGGKSYYRIGSGQSPYRVELTDTEIVIKQSFYEEKEAVTAKLVMLQNGDLKVIESNGSRFQVGQILSISNNYLS